MIRSRIVEIDGALDEAQTKEPDIEIEVSLRIARDRGDVMESWDFGVHEDDLRLNNPRTFWVKSDNGDARQHNRKDENDECVSLNGVSVCVGAIAYRAGIFRNDCTTNTKRLKYKQITAPIT